jgi:hypothetical protein
MWISVFRAGKHQDNKGNDLEFSVDDLNVIANKYNNQPKESKRIAPLIPGGHEKLYYSDGQLMIKPSMGWVEKLKVEGEKLLAKIDPTQKFTEAVKGKYYRGVSISLLEDKMLDHIAVLGAVKPAVAGLPDMVSSFTMGVKELTDIESYEFSLEETNPKPDTGTKPKENFEEPNTNSNNNQTGENMKLLLDTVKLIEWVKAEFGDETATKIQEKLPEFKAEEEESNDGEGDTGEGDDSTGGQDSQEGNFSESEDKEKTELQNRINALEAKNRLYEFNQFIGTTNVPEGVKLKAVNALEIAHTAEATNFSVKDEKGAETNPTSLMKSLLKAWPELVELGADGDVNASNFSSPDKDEAISSAAKKYNENR